MAGIWLFTKSHPTRWSQVIGILIYVQQRTIDDQNQDSENPVNTNFHGCGKIWFQQTNIKQLIVWASLSRSGQTGLGKDANIFEYTILRSRSTKINICHKSVLSSPTEDGWDWWKYYQIFFNNLFGATLGISQGEPQGIKQGPHCLDRFWVGLQKLCRVIKECFLVWDNFPSRHIREGNLPLY